MGNGHEVPRSQARQAPAQHVTSGAVPLAKLLFTGYNSVPGCWIVGTSQIQSLHQQSLDLLQGGRARPT
jgi:hypothetical protein